MHSKVDYAQQTKTLRVHQIEVLAAEQPRTPENACVVTLSRLSCVEITPLLFCQSQRGFLIFERTLSDEWLGLRQPNVAKTACPCGITHIMVINKREKTEIARKEITH